MTEPNQIPPTVNDPGPVPDSQRRRLRSRSMPVVIALVAHHCGDRHRQCLEPLEAAKRKHRGVRCRCVPQRRTRSR